MFFSRWNNFLLCTLFPSSATEKSVISTNSQRPLSHSRLDRYVLSMAYTFLTHNIFKSRTTNFFTTESDNCCNLKSCTVVDKFRVRRIKVKFPTC